MQGSWGCGVSPALLQHQRVLKPWAGLSQSSGKNKLDSVFGAAYSVNMQLSNL